MRFAKLSAGLFIIVLLLAGAAGAAHAGMMAGQGNMGDMVGCALMGHNEAVCGMNPLKHLSGWQNLFAAVPAQNAMMLFMLLLALFFFLRFNQYLRFLYPPPQAVRIFYDPAIVMYDSLRLFMARGLMHPKIF
ncbi:MAG: hypothetical protein HYV67_01370 [Candidatus Taylorbacteria bacterium]|nr:hypothetical protein [Candidatus Taylorbacteria bacterium]